MSNEVRSWVGGHRHVTSALLAHAYLTVVQAQATHRAAQKSRLSSTRQR
jgi:SRSO17 transposase